MSDEEKDEEEEAKEPEEKGKTVLLKVKTVSGVKNVRLKVKEKQPAAPPPAYPYSRGYPSEQTVYVVHGEGGAVKAEGIRTGIITPIQGIPAGTALSPAMSAVTSTVTVKKEEKPSKPLKGISIPEVSETITAIAPAAGMSLTDLRMINIKYPLIPKRPKKGEAVLAYAQIFFDEKAKELVYYVVEPHVDEKLKDLIAELKAYLQEKIDISFSQIRKREAITRLEDIFKIALNFFRIKDPAVTEIIRYYVFRDFIGLEKLEPFLNDRNLEDISCDGVNIPLYVYHRDPRLGSLRTNIFFDDKDELDLFVNKLSERCGKVISVAHPMLDAALPDGSRIQATLGSDIARQGSNFTIRMFTEQPITPVDIIKFGTSDLRTMAVFWFFVEHGMSLLVCGGTATGKTSLLNALSLFIKPQMKIVSIEDTPELRLPHSHWIAEVARTPIAEEGKVDMFELLRESLRQRPDYIILGEVRGQEAYVLFQQMAVGHPGMATLHAENFPKLVDRLTTKPISLPANLLQTLDMVIFIKRVKQERRYKRRIASAIEVVGFDKEKRAPITNEIIAWDPKKDSFNVTAESTLLKKISDTTGMTESFIQEEIKKRVKVLQWMTEKNITDYKKHGVIFNLFYTAPDLLLQRIGKL